MAIEKITPSGSATPRGHYSPGVRAGDFIFVSGQGPIDPVSDKLVVTDVATQTRLTLENVQRVLQAAGAELSDVVKVSVFLKHIDDFKAMNQVYGEFFGEIKPARTTIESTFHQAEMLVEVDCIAYSPLRRD